MSRIENGFHLIGGWLTALLLLPFYPIAYLIGWADEVAYRRRVMRDIRSRTNPTTPTRPQQPGPAPEVPRGSDE